MIDQTTMDTVSIIRIEQSDIDTHCSNNDTTKKDSSVAIRSHINTVYDDDDSDVDCLECYDDEDAASTKPLTYQEMQDSMLGNSFANFDYAATIPNTNSNSMFDLEFEDEEDEEKVNEENLSRSRFHDSSDSANIFSLIENFGDSSNQTDNDFNSSEDDDTFWVPMGHDSLKRFDNKSITSNDFEESYISRISFDDNASLMSSSTTASNHSNNSSTNNNEKRRVRFSTVSVREYSITVGLHSTHCPIQLSWEHTEQDTVIDIRYNNLSDSRNCCRKNQLTRLPYRFSVDERREYIAKVQGITIDDVHQLEQEIDQLKQRSNAIMT